MSYDVDDEVVTYDVDEVDDEEVDEKMRWQEQIG